LLLRTGAILRWQRVSDYDGLDLQNSSMNEQGRMYPESVRYGYATFL
jgi:hypothetical protein